MNARACRLLLLSLVGLSGMIFAGCASTPPGEGRQHVNLLGIVEVTEKSFEPAGELTFEVKEGDLVSNDERSGRQVKLLWGLITYTDY